MQESTKALLALLMPMDEVKPIVADNSKDQASGGAGTCLVLFDVYCHAVQR